MRNKRNFSRKEKNFSRLNQSSQRIIHQGLKKRLMQTLEKLKKGECKKVYEMIATCILKLMSNVTKRKGLIPRINWDSVKKQFVVLINDMHYGITLELPIKVTHVSASA